MSSFVVKKRQLMLELAQLTEEGIVRPEKTISVSEFGAAVREIAQKDPELLARIRAAVFAHEAGVHWNDFDALDVINVINVILTSKAGGSRVAKIFQQLRTDDESP